VRGETKKKKRGGKAFEGRSKQESLRVAMNLRIRIRKRKGGLTSGYNNLTDGMSGEKDQRSLSLEGFELKSEGGR